MPTNYGDTGAKMMISDANTLNGSTYIFYFWTPSVKGAYQNNSKIKQLTGGSSYSDRGGKRNWSVSLADCYVVKNQQATITAEFNIILDFLAKLCKTGAAPCYLWVVNEADNDNVALGNNAAASSQTDYMKGYVTDYSWEMLPGKLYKFNLKFQECLS